MGHQFLPRAWRRPTDKQSGTASEEYTVDMGLRDRVALVFGGGTGIGRATAVELAREGAAVVVAGRRNAVLAESIEEIEAAGGRAMGIVADVSRPEDVTRVVTATVAELGRLDAVANCAAIVDRRASMLTGPVELFDQIMGVNLRGAWLVVGTAAQTMIDTGTPGAHPYRLVHQRPTARDGRLFDIQGRCRGTDPRRGQGARASRHPGQRPSIRVCRHGHAEVRLGCGRGCAISYRPGLRSGSAWACWSTIGGCKGDRLALLAGRVLHHRNLS